MILSAFFTEDGAPKTGLTPTITVYDISDGSLSVDAQAMTEVAGGFYKYDFTTFDRTKNYAIVADGGVSQGSGERYAFSTSGMSGDVDMIKQIETGRWKIDTSANTLTLYEDDNETEIVSFNLKDSSENASSTNVFERTKI